MSNKKTSFLEQASPAYKQILLGNMSFDKKDYEQAIKEYSKAIQLSTYYLDKAEAYIQRAEAYSKNGENEMAFDDYQRAICLLKFREEKHPVHEAKGDLYTQLMSWDNAIKEYTIALELAEGSFNRKLDDIQNVKIRIHQKRGNIMEKLAQHEKATVDYARIIEVCLKDDMEDTAAAKTTAYFSRARCYRRIGSFGKAIKDYASIIEYSTDEDKSNATKYKAKAHADFTEHTEAIAEYTKLIHLYDISKEHLEKARAYIERGKAYRNLEKITEAYADYTQAIKISDSKEDIAKALEKRAALQWIHAKNTASAIEDLTEAIKLYTEAFDLARCYRYRSYVYLESGKREEYERDMAASEDYYTL